MKRIRDSGYFRAFRVDAELPASGVRRILVIGWLVLGALVALLVPVVLAVLIWGLATGQDEPTLDAAPEPAPAAVSDRPAASR